MILQPSVMDRHRSLLKGVFFKDTDIKLKVIQKIYILKFFS